MVVVVWWGWWLRLPLPQEVFGIMARGGVGGWFVVHRRLPLPLEVDMGSSGGDAGCVGVDTWCGSGDTGCGGFG